MARTRKRTRYEELQDAAAEKGIWLATHSPGDGVTRYRFFANPGNSYFGPDNGIVTVLGSKKAWEFVEAYGWGRGSSRDSAKSTKKSRPHTAVLITRKKYKRTNGGIKVKKSQYHIKSRDPSSYEVQIYDVDEEYGEGWFTVGTFSSLVKAEQNKEKYSGERVRIVRRKGGSPKSTRPVSRRRDPLAPLKAGCPVGTQVQSVILSQQFFSLREAESWIRRNGFHISKIDESQNFWRFRQQPPTRFEKESFRTIRLRPGVEAVIGCPL